MGYEVVSIERSPIMAELLADAYQRLGEQSWVKALSLSLPELIHGDALEVLHRITDKPDCIYLDPMFPPKRKKSALAKKSIRVLRELAGDDEDKVQLFEAALKFTGKRVVVKSPDYAEPLGGKPSEIYQSKLIRYDVYFK
jgi:16S rRNA (guanine1516-N2)-methyltransferase